MNPVDAPVQDWRMYYNNTWMMHNKHGPVLVMVAMHEETGQSYLTCHIPGKLGEKSRKLSKIDSRNLTLWWPPMRAYNYDHRAVYLARRAQRQMRKSASYPDTYYASWGHGPSNIRMLQMVLHAEYVTVGAALAALSANLATGRAISHHIILTRKREDQAGIIYKGIDVGYMKYNNTGVKIHANCVFPKHRIKTLLREEGITC